MAQFWLSDPWYGDPLPTFDQLRRGLDDVFERFTSGVSRRSRVFPPVNVYESSEGYVLTAELPGLSADDVEISVEGNRLTLSGERRIEHPANAGKHRVERASGGFRRVIALPRDLAPEKALAVCRHGILMVRIPRLEEQKPRRISVKGN
jgi:HSP20 family protein